MREILLFLSLFMVSPTFQSGATLGALWACSEDGSTGFLPENDLYIPPWSLRGAGQIVDEITFHHILDRVEAIYEPMVYETGAQLVLERFWTEGKVNAKAFRGGPTKESWHVQMFGGLARHHTITPDGFALVACHELGHHLAGIPRSDWASNEGQSDYFASSKCFRRYARLDDNILIQSYTAVPDRVYVYCHLQHFDPEEAAICERASMAGLSLANLLNSFGRSPTPLSFETPDETDAHSTYHGHPEPQCRLDTFFHGALCERGEEEPFSLANSQGYCTRTERDYGVGVRPRCWYQPQYNN